MKTKLVLAAWIALPLTSLAAELHFQCPERYPGKVLEFTEAPAGWSGAVGQVSAGLPLSGGGMTGASPKLQPPADLRGNEVMARAGVTETRYPVAGESWLYCAYGQGGENRLYRRVDGTGVRECLAKFVERKASAMPVMTMTCK